MVLFKQASKIVNRKLAGCGFVVSDLGDIIYPGLFFARREPDINFYYVSIEAKSKRNQGGFMPYYLNPLDIPKIVVTEIYKNTPKDGTCINLMVYNSVNEKIYFSDINTILSIGSIIECPITGIDMIRVAIQLESRHSVCRGFQLYGEHYIYPEYRPTPLDPSSTSVRGIIRKGVKNC